MIIYITIIVEGHDRLCVKNTLVNKYVIMLHMLTFVLRDNSQDSLYRKTMSRRLYGITHRIVSMEKLWVGDYIG